MNTRIVVVIVIMMSLGVILTIQSVSAQPPGTIRGNLPVGDLCQTVPQLCNDGGAKIVKWCEITPEKCLKAENIPDKIFRIPPDPNCPECHGKVIVDLNPFDFIVLGQLKNNTIAIQMSPQDVQNMLGNVTSMTNASATAK